MDRIVLQNNLDSFSVRLVGDEPLSKIKNILKTALLEEILKRDESQIYHEMVRETCHSLKTNDSGYRCCLMGIIIIFLENLLPEGVVKQYQIIP